MHCIFIATICPLIGGCVLQLLGTNLPSCQIDPALCDCLVSIACLLEQPLCLIKKRRHSQTVVDISRVLPVIIVGVVFASLASSTRLVRDANACSCWCYPQLGNILPFTYGRDLVCCIHTYVHTIPRYPSSYDFVMTCVVIYGVYHSRDYTYKYTPVYTVQV